MKKTILVADDDPDYGSMLRDALEEAGFEVRLLSQGMQVPAEVHKGEFDLVVLDLAMPELNGLEVARGLAKSGNKVPLAVLTGHDEPEIRSEAAAAGIGVFLTKESNISDIISSLRELLGA